MKNTSTWAYPCHVCSETYCITAIKSQAAGIIPVISKPGELDKPFIEKHHPFHLFDARKIL